MPLRSVAGFVRLPSLSISTVRSRQTFAEMKARQRGKLEELKTALVAGGFDSASKQAAALCLSRSTAWKVLKSDHKNSGLTASTIKQMLASPKLPPEARKIIEEYVLEKLLGAYGHGPKSLKTFRRRLGLPTQPIALEALQGQFSNV